MSLTLSSCSGSGDADATGFSHASGNKSNVVEGVARIVSVENGLAVLEPIQSGGCGGCSIASVCNEKGIGTLASRLEARRFTVPDALDLQPGDQVVLGIRPRSLVAASAAAYFFPLCFALVGGAWAQFHFGKDIYSLMGMVAGLVPGFLLTYLFSRKMATSGGTELQLIRQAESGSYCQ